MISFQSCLLKINIYFTKQQLSQWWPASLSICHCETNIPLSFRPNSEMPSYINHNHVVQVIMTANVLVICPLPFIPIVCITSPSPSYQEISNFLSKQHSRIYSYVLKDVSAFATYAFMLEIPTAVKQASSSQ